MNGVYSFFQKKASSIGPYTVQYITRLILQYPYKPIGYKQANGITAGLARLYSSTRVENACERASVLDRCSFQIIENMLKSGMDQLEMLTIENNHIPEHENIRGANHYQ